MSEIDTLIGGSIGIAGAVIAAIIVHILDERREKNRLRRETALRPLHEKQLSLRDAYYSVIDLAIAIGKARANPKGNQENLAVSMEHCIASLSRTTLWMMASPDYTQRITQAMSLLPKAFAKIFSSEGLSEKEYHEYVSSNLGKVAVEIGKGLGIEVLEGQIREFWESGYPW